MESNRPCKKCQKPVETDRPKWAKYCKACGLTGVATGNAKTPTSFTTRTMQAANGASETTGTPTSGPGANNIPLNTAHKTDDI